MKSKLQIKICGMQQAENILACAELEPQYLGFIFFEASKRHFNGNIPSIDKNIKKIGVFVNEEINQVIETIEKYQLDGVQLHGEESVGYCHEIKLKYENIEIIKVFSIDEQFQMKRVEPYLEIVDLFLFDTKGKDRGGNGVTFNWELLESYQYKKPYLLSGGIGLEEVEPLKKFMTKPYSKPCIGLDLNSRFESKPGMKQIEKLKEFKKQLNINS